MIKKRQIIKIDEEKCNGCGQCESACVEGAIRIIDGKAKLVSESYCDGLGACLGDCPVGAITIEERPAEEFNEEAVKQYHESRKAAVRKPEHVTPCACPGSAMRTMKAQKSVSQGCSTQQSHLGSWPVQITLVPPTAPFLKNAHLLITADCAPFALPDFHETYLSGRVPLVGCPKLDDIEYYNHKLGEIIEVAEPSSITVLRMEVPCCGGLARVVMDARNRVGSDVPVEIVTVGINGNIIRESVPTPAVSRG
jgi:ferredoxin